MSGIDLADGREVRKGAAASVAQWIQDSGGTVPDDLGPLVDGISAAGRYPAGGGRAGQRHAPRPSA